MNNDAKKRSLLDVVNPDVVHSQMTWVESTPGREPPPLWPPNTDLVGQSMTSDDWFACQDYFIQRDGGNNACQQLKPSCEYFPSGECMNKDEIKASNMWAPRRGHAAIVANNAIYVIGGRVREQSEVADSSLIGGINVPRAESNQDRLTTRQRIALKNDVWVSRDGEGKSWTLVTPGCRDHQEDILMKTEAQSDVISRGKSSIYNLTGNESSRCKTSSDCYGDAICKILDNSSNGLCVCPMFGMREHHSISVQHRYHTRANGDILSEDYIYVVGGFTHVRQKFCGGQACASHASYRIALDDAWVTNDGSTWIQLRPALVHDIYKSRGGHSSVLMHANLFRKQEVDKLWIIGGQSVSLNTSSSEYLNDVWTIDVPREPCCILDGNCDAIPHEPLQTNHIGNCLPETSKWKLLTRNPGWGGRTGHAIIHEPPSSLNTFVDRMYIIGGRNDSSVFSDVWSLTPLINETWNRDYMLSSSYDFYYDMTSSISELKRLQLPVTTAMVDEEFIGPNSIPMLKQKDIRSLKNLGVVSLSDLVHSDQYTILQLRGFDFPGKTSTNVVSDICRLKALLHSFELKCSIVEADMLETLENFKRQNYGPGIDEQYISQQWDGCQAIDGYSYIDVHGIGIVTVPTNKYDISADLENMFCKQKAGSRYMATGQFVDGKVLILGGQHPLREYLYQDVWSRDNSFPRASMSTVPSAHSSQSTFVFDCDEDGAVQFEYKLFDPDERIDITPWLSARKGEHVDVSWLDSKKGGPGSGLYTMYLRAIDPAGNRDIEFSPSTNAYTWFYLQPLPWGMISLGICGAIMLIIGSIVEYRRRERKAALERYAQRRMRRKFKLQEENNWAERSPNRRSKIKQDEESRHHSADLKSQRKKRRRHKSRVMNNTKSKIR